MKLYSYYILSKMRFCNNCNNMLYLGINPDDSNELTYYCRFCGNTDNMVSESGICVLNTQFSQSEQKFNHIINEFTKLDPTLPRINNIKCPNDYCKTNDISEAQKENPEVIYIRYDDSNLKYLYMCTTCDTTWKTGDRS